MKMIAPKEVESHGEMELAFIPDGVVEETRTEMHLATVLTQKDRQESIIEEDTRTEILDMAVAESLLRIRFLLLDSML
jgi:hypothetical protein